MPDYVHLNAHQQAVLDAVLSSGERVHLLQGAPGTGRSTTAVALVEEVSRREPEALVVVLAQRRDIPQLARRYRDVGLPVTTVADQRDYRWRSQRNEFFHGGPAPFGVWIISLTMLKQMEIVDTLVHLPVSLLILEDLNPAKSDNVPEVRQLLDHARRVLIVTLADPPAQTLGVGSTQFHHLERAVSEVITF